MAITSDGGNPLASKQTDFVSTTRTPLNVGVRRQSANVATKIAMPMSAKATLRGSRPTEQKRWVPTTEPMP